MHEVSSTRRYRRGGAIAQQTLWLVRILRGAVQTYQAMKKSTSSQKGVPDNTPKLGSSTQKQF